MKINSRILLSLILIASLAFAHGDEDHGEHTSPAKPTASASIDAVGPSIYVAKESQFLFSVKTIPAKSKEMRGQVRVLGKITARSGGSAELFAPLTGVVQAPSKDKVFLPGDAVKKGELLAVIEGSLGATELLGLATSKVEAKARVAGAEAKVAAAERELKRLEGLSGIVSVKEVQTAKTELEIAQAELTGARKAAGIASGSGGANRFEIKAPIDGIIAEVGATVGGIVDPDRPLFRIIDFSTLWVEAQIFEEDLPKIQGLESAIVQPENLGDSEFEAKLISLGRVINEQSRTVPAIFEVQNPEGILRVGMFARVGIIAGQNITAISVPKTAIIDQVGRKIIYVHTLPEFFEARAVELGPESGDQVAIRKGLREGDRIVVDGISTIRVAAGGR